MNLYWRQRPNLGRWMLSKGWHWSFCRKGFISSLKNVIKNSNLTKWVKVRNTSQESLILRPCKTGKDQWPKLARDDFKPDLTNVLVRICLFVKNWVLWYLVKIFLTGPGYSSYITFLPETNKLTKKGEKNQTPRKWYLVVWT